MATSTAVAPRSRFARQPVSALGKLTIAAMLGMSLLLILMMAVLIREFVPPLAVFAALPLVAAGLILTGWRWTPILASLVAAVLLLMFYQPLVFELQHPEVFGWFATMLVLVAVLAIAIVGGIAATVQNYRVPAADRRAPRGLQSVLLAMAAFIVGGLAVAAIPQQGAAAGIDPEALSGLPAITTKDFEFAQKEIRVKAGETVTFRLENEDQAVHYFDIDALNIHAPMPVGKTGVAMFKPTAPGEYIFYCAPHTSPDRTEGMVGKLIVEP
jgi:plastocyanin